MVGCHGLEALAIFSVTLTDDQGDVADEIDGSDAAPPALQLPLSQLRLHGEHMGFASTSYGRSTQLVSVYVMLQATISVRARTSSIPAPSPRTARPLAFAERPESTSTEKRSRGRAYQNLGCATSRLRGESAIPLLRDGYKLTASSVILPSLARTSCSSTCGTAMKSALCASSWERRMFSKLLVHVIRNPREPSSSSASRTTIASRSTSSMSSRSVMALRRR
jgi:hypothetical protein